VRKEGKEGKEGRGRKRLTCSTLPSPTISAASRSTIFSNSLLDTISKGKDQKKHGRAQTRLHSLRIKYRVEGKKYLMERVQDDS
jgi:hypothetical protein